MEHEGGRLGAVQIEADVERLLGEARTKFRSMVDVGRIARRGKVMGIVGPDETEIQGDKAMGEFFYRQLANLAWVDGIQIEGCASVEWRILSRRRSVHVDPLDGSANCLTNRTTLPHGACVTVVEHPPDGSHPRWRDIVACGAVNYLSGTVYLCRRNGDGTYRTRIEGPRGVVQSFGSLDPGNQVLYVETYYLRMRALAAEMFTENGNFRSLGSALIEMLLVSEGVAAAFFCETQKQHEGPVGALCTLGAGMVAIGPRAENLLDTPYDFNAKTGVVLAANIGIAYELCERYAKVARLLDTKKR